MFKRIALILILLLLPAAAGADPPWVVGEQGVTSGDGAWKRLRGNAYCRIWGTFDSATVDLETKLIDGTVADVGVAALVGVTSATAWVGLAAGDGEYRIETTGGGGSQSVNWECRVFER